jgi:peptidoglycan/LPS O-acetylase OafA/YrhL
MTGAAEVSRVSEQSSKVTQRFYRPELDALRFVAFFSVLIFHFTFYISHRGFWLEAIRYSGAFGMCLFFILSAYLITELLTREKEKTGTIHIKAFYLRRILRIWPLYFAFIAWMWFFGRYIFHPWFVPKATVISFILLMGNWRLIYGSVTGPIMPLWSISLEEQFYLVWPTLAKLGKRALLIISLLVIVMSYLVIAGLTYRGTHFSLIWWNSFVQFQYFGLGAVLSLTLRGRAPQIQKGKRAALFLLALPIWALGGYFNFLNAFGVHPVLTLMLSYLAASVGCLMLFFAFLGAPEGTIPDWMMQLGKISYGLYVFHQFCIDSVATIWSRYVHAVLPESVKLSIWFVCALAITIAVAKLSYRFLETPFLEFKRRFEFIETRKIPRENHNR